MNKIKIASQLISLAKDILKASFTEQELFEKTNTDDAIMLIEDCLQTRIDDLSQLKEYEYFMDDEKMFVDNGKYTVCWYYRSLSRYVDVNFLKEFAIKNFGKKMSEAPVVNGDDYGNLIPNSELKNFPSSEGHRVTSSSSRHCYMYKATDGKWYMSLADDIESDDEYEEPTVRDYGPFNSEDDTIKYLNRNFSNPGGWGTDSSGKRKPPTKPRK